VTYVAYIVGHEIVVLLLLLYSMLKVNGIIDEVLNNFSIRAIEEILSSAAMMEEEISRDEQRIRRLELNLVMRDHKIGTTIWSYRPTKLQLLLQITSIVTIVATTILKIIVVNATT
jgi:hypothetical protein